MNIVKYFLLGVGVLATLLQAKGIASPEDGDMISETAWEWSDAMPLLGFLWFLLGAHWWCPLLSRSRRVQPDWVRLLGSLCGLFVGLWLWPRKIVSPEHA